MIRGTEGWDRYGTDSAILRRVNGVQWTLPNGSGGVSFSTLTASGRGQALRLGADATGVAGSDVILRGAFDAGFSQISLGFGMEIFQTAIPGNDSIVNVALVETGQNVTHGTISFNRHTGHIIVMNAAGTVVGSSQSQIFTRAQYFFAEILLIVGSAGSLLVLANNEQAVSVPSSNFQGGSLSVCNGISIDVPSISGTMQAGCVIDDMRWADNQPGPGIFPTNGIIGPAYLLPAFVTSNGDTLQWTPSGGSNFQNVQAPIGDATSSNSATASATSSITDLYNLGKVSTNITTMLALDIGGDFTQAASDDQVIGFIDSRAGQSGHIATATVTGSVALVLDTVNEIDPITGTAWRLADINASQFGVTLLEDSSAGSWTGGSLTCSAAGTLDGNIGGPPPRPSNLTTITAGQEGCLFQCLLTSYGTGFNGLTEPIGGFMAIAGDKSGSYGPDPVTLNIVGWQGDDNGARCLVTLTLLGGTAPTTQSASSTFTFTGATDSQCVLAISGQCTVRDETAHNVDVAMEASVSGTPWGTFTFLDVPFNASPVRGFLNGILCQATLGGLIFSNSFTNALPPGDRIVTCDHLSIGALVTAGNYSGGIGMPPIFPQLAGWQWTVEPYDKTQVWSTGTATAASGATIRTRYWQNPLWEWTLGWDYLPDEQANGTTESDLKTMMGFFGSLGGPWQGFLFPDPDDNKVVGQPLGSTDSTTASFLIVRTLGGSYGSVTEPVGYVNLDEQFNLYLDGVQQDPSTYTVVQATPLAQIVQFNSAPAGVHAITADFSFYYYVNFVDETMTFSKFANLRWDCKSVKIRSLRQA